MNDQSDTAGHPESTVRRRHRTGFRHRLKQLMRVVLALFLVALVVGWWNVLRIVEHDSWPPPADAVMAAQSQAITEEFARRDDPRRDDIAIPYAPSTVSEVQLFAGGEEFFPAMLDDIAAAEHSIHIAMFVFTPGRWGEQFADALIQRANEGIEVRLTVDRFGSKITGWAEDMYRDLAAAGIEVAVNDVFPLQATGLLPDRSVTWSQDEVGRADHRKMFVIDGRIGWMGGAGFDDHFHTGEYYDVHVRVQGDVIRQLQAVFLTGFVAYGGPLPGEEGALAAYFPEADDPGDIRTTVLLNVPGGHLPGTQATRALLDNADERIDILNPYLSDPGIIDQIVEAAERGVHVRAVVPEESNSPPAQAALEHRYPELLDAGVEMWESVPIMHAKVLIADDATIVGSLNYDAWAMYRNMEISLLFEDAGVAEDVRQAFVDPSVAAASPGEVTDSTVEQVRNWFWDKLTYFL